MLPDEVISDSATLFAVRMWNQLSMDKDERLFTGKKSSLLEGVMELVDGYHLFYNTGSIEKCRRAFQRGLDLIPAEFSEISNTCRLLVGAMERLNGDLYEAEKAFLFDLKEDRFERRFYSSLIQSINRIELHFHKGEFSKAEEILEQSFSLIKAMGRGSEFINTGFLWLEKAVLSFCKNELSLAYDSVRRSPILSRSGDSDEIILSGNILQGRIEIALGLLDEAEKSYQKAKEHAGDSSPLFLDIIEACIADLKMRKGASIEPWAEKSRCRLNDLKEQGPFPPLLFEQFLVFVDYLMEKKDFEESEKCLDYMTSGLLKTGHILKYIQGRLRIACIKYHQNFMVEADQIIKEILTLNGKEKNIRIFAEGGKECSHLLAVADQKGYLPDFLKEFAQSDQKRKKVHLEINDFQETFNDRELDIIRYMGQGLSNQEISDTIYLSINTVRWYARQIYMKLDVKRRGEAAAKALSLGLI